MKRTKFAPQPEIADPHPNAKYAEWITREGLLRIEGWARDGLTEAEIAANIGIAERTLQTWKNRFPSLDHILKQGKDVVDRAVEGSLLEMAMGMTKKIIKPMKRKEVMYENGKRVSEIEYIEYVEEEVYYPPNTTAIIFWLKNRKYQEWRDKREIEHSGGVKHEHEQKYHIIQELIQQPDVRNRIEQELADDYGFSLEECFDRG